MLESRNLGPMIAMEMSTIKYRAEIDGLRALAVISVVLYHAFPGLIPGGFVGVDIFFVISGYLITSILLQENKRGEFSILEFYRRRINRIFPALLVVMISVMVFCWFTFFSDEYMQLGKHVAGGAGFVSNIVLYSESGYFDSSSAVKPLLHLWSLGVEEQYYIVLPVLLWALYRLRLSLFVSLAIVALASFSFGAIEVYKNQISGFYLPQYRAWELFAGSLIACASASESDARLPLSVRKALAVVGLILIAACLFLYSESLIFPGFYALPPVIGSCMVIMYAKYFRPVNVLLSNRLAVIIGLISYPLYLWHWPVISITRIINGDIPPSSVQAYGLILSLALACGTYFLVERPLKRIKSVKLKTIPLALMMIIVGSFGYYVFINNGVETRGIVASSKAVNSQLNGALWQYINNDNCKERYHFEYQGKMPVWFCEMKYNRAPDVLLLGNSYANHLYPGIAINPNSDGVNILSIGTSDITYGLVSGIGSVGERQMVFLNNIIKSEPSIRTVIISGVNPRPDDRYIENLKKRVDFIASEGKKIIIFYPHAMMNKNIKACFTRPLKPATQDCHTGIGEVNEIRKNFSTLETAIRESHPDVMFFDPNKVFCSKSGCSSVIDGLPVFRDDYKHFSVYASEKVGDHFYEWARQENITL
ncbi:acyltransferase family protein [Lelliottia amnigena]|uniref:acyltransferase family protein n=1 Tax=Lelliottia amnigena TaxID=61646 RepID=UPI0040564D39